MQSYELSPALKTNPKEGLQRARESGSHEDSTLSTVRRSSASSAADSVAVSDNGSCSIQERNDLRMSNEKLRHQVEDLQRKNEQLFCQVEDLHMKNEQLQHQVDVVQSTIGAQLAEITDRDRDISTLKEIVQSLQSQLKKKADIEALQTQIEAHRQAHDEKRIQNLNQEVEALKVRSDNYRNELWTFARLFRDRRDTIEKEHREEIEDWKRRHSALATDLVLASQQCLRYHQHNGDLCQLVDSLNIYVCELENRFNEVLQSKSAELESVRRRHDDSMENLRSRDERLDLFKAGVRRAAAFLAELAEK